MKFRLSFVMCAVLIGIISLQTVAASADFHECAGMYLQSKGQLEGDVSSFKKSSECMIVMQNFKREFRNGFEKFVKNVLSDENESRCVLAGFDESEFTNKFIKIEFVKSESSLIDLRSEMEATLNTIKEEINNLARAVVTKCEIDKESIEAFVF